MGRLRTSADRLADAAYWTPASQRENLEAGLSLARLLAEQPSAEACLESQPRRGSGRLPGV